MAIEAPSDPSPDLECSLGDVELAADAVVGHPDLSVIMEQSCFIDHLAIPFTDEEQPGGDDSFILSFFRTKICPRRSYSFFSP